MAGTAGGHALVRAYWPGSYQVTSATPRFPAVEDETAEGQPLGVTEAIRVTPPSGPRLPDRSQASHERRVTLTKRLLDSRHARILRQAAPVARGLA